MLTNLEYLKKVYRTLCGIKCDIKSLNDEVENMADKFDIRFYGSSTVERNPENTFQVKLYDLPLETIDELNGFEKKLLMNDFKTKLVKKV